MSLKAVGSAIKKPVRIAGAGIVLSVAAIAGFEGLETKPYYDIGGVLTYCYGETKGAVINAEYTPKQCKTLLENRVAGFHKRVMSRVLPASKEKLTPKQEAALVSFAYNVGVGAFERSTLLKKLNAGDVRGACEQLDRWVYVGRTYVQGLANRRKAEKQMCLSGLTPEEI